MFLEVVGIVPSSWAWRSAWRVSWKWSFYYLWSASPSKLVRPYTKAQPSMKKTNCPHSLLYCTPNPCMCFPQFRDSPRKPGSAEAEGPTFPGPTLTKRTASVARTQARSFPGSCQGQGRGGGRARSWWLCVFPVIAMGIGKETWLICLMNYASLLLAALPASKLYYSRCLNPPPQPSLPWKLLSNKYQGSFWLLISMTT